MPIFLFAETTSASASPLEALGVNVQAFILQLITFLLVFIILKKLAFNRVVAILEKRRLVIEDGVKLGEQLAKEREEQAQQAAETIRNARHEADLILSNAQKEGRQLLRQAEKAAHQKTKVILEEAEIKSQHESALTKRKLQKDLVHLVADATEAVVGQKIDRKKDAAIIEAAVKGRLT
ncbi:MAG: F0F1 ATP synthase subunit B [Patescibacteria group bacterium]